MMAPTLAVRRLVAVVPATPSETSCLQMQHSNARRGAAVRTARRCCCGLRERCEELLAGARRSGSIIVSDIANPDPSTMAKKNQSRPPAGPPRQPSSSVPPAPGDALPPKSQRGKLPASVQVALITAGLGLVGTLLATFAGLFSSSKAAQAQAEPSPSSPTSSVIVGDIEAKGSVTIRIGQLESEVGRLESAPLDEFATITDLAIIHGELLNLRKALGKGTAEHAAVERMLMRTDGLFQRLVLIHDDAASRSPDPAPVANDAPASPLPHKDSPARPLSWIEDLHPYDAKDLLRMDLADCFTDAGTQSHREYLQAHPEIRPDIFMASPEKAYRNEKGGRMNMLQHCATSTTTVDHARFQLEGRGLSVRDLPCATHGRLARHDDMLDGMRGSVSNAVRTTAATQRP